MYHVGVDLGGTKILTGLIDEDGRIEKYVRRDTNAYEGPNAVVARIVETVKEVTTGVARGHIGGIGIGSPGPLDSHTGVVLSPPNLPGWKNVPLKAIVEERTQLHTVLENDANAAAIGENYFGAGNNSTDLVYVTVSTGIGAGIIVNGSLMRGKTGSAGEIGHMIVDAHGRQCICGNRGCLEALSSGTSIAKIAREQFGEEHDAAEVADMAKNGDELAKRILDESFGYLGLGLVNIIHIFNPSVVVIGGGVSKVGKPMFDVLTQVVRNRAFPTSGEIVEIKPAELGGMSGMIGSAVLARLHRSENQQQRLHRQQV
ncbi:ROK family protein [Alicyclobacillus sp. SO9]|uniref:ROK family protein n=1 Tax=Alicyclobacillus sp. SO9 TaxID=2665646 RepID=UPI0018E72DA2|nr:ROK family protein [Alicyclobacillus sp. SO9]QQE77736.1 ROK family protein [Alicyclobacillus sp. SO9]